MKLTSALAMAVSAIACSFTVFTANAQTCDNSGVGTKIPASKLELRGCGTTSSTSVFNATNKDSTSLFFIRDDGKIGVGTKTPTNIFSFNGNATRNIWMERHTTANTAGNDFYLQAGGAASGGTNLNGGNLYLTSGISTGTGSSSIRFQTFGDGVSGTTDAAATTRMIITGAGRIGIGTGNTAPAAALELRAPAVANGAEAVFRFGITDAFTNDLFSISNFSDVNGVFAPVLAGRCNSVTNQSPLFFVGQINAVNDVGSEPIVKFDAYNIGAPALQFTNRPLYVFSAGDITKMSIRANGNVGIGDIVPDQMLSVNGNASKVGGGSWATFSDKTIKKDVIAFNDGLEVLKKIKPVKFKYNSIYTDTTSEFVGILAQDMQQVAPYTVKSTKLIVTEKDSRAFPNRKFAYKDVIKAEGLEEKTVDKYEIETLSYDQSAVFYIMVNAIKELDKKNADQAQQLQQQNQQLQQQNEELKVALTAVQKRLAALESK